MIFTEVDEHGHDVHSGENLFEQYWELMLDAPHALVEITYAIVPIIIYELFRRLWTRAWSKHLDRRLAEEHARIDAEHGVEHHDPEAPASP